MSMKMIMRAKSKARAAATDVSIQDYMVGVMVRYEGGLHDGWFPSGVSSTREMGEMEQVPHAQRARGSARQK